MGALGWTLTVACNAVPLWLLFSKKGQALNARYAKWLREKWVDAWVEELTVPALLVWWVLFTCLRVAALTYCVYMIWRVLS